MFDRKGKALLGINDVRSSSGIFHRSRAKVVKHVVVPHGWNDETPSVKCHVFFQSVNVRMTKILPWWRKIMTRRENTVMSCLACRGRHYLSYVIVVEWASASPFTWANSQNSSQSAGKIVTTFADSLLVDVTQTFVSRPHRSCSFNTNIEAILFPSRWRLRWSFF